MSIPVLRTERLILRGHVRADFPAFAAMRADPVVMRFMGKGDTFTEEDAWLRFLSTIGHWELLGYGTWAVEEIATARLIGGLGYAEKKRPAEHPASGAPEMGWLFASDVQGKGFASEALRAALAWGAEHFGPTRVVCVISDDNAASVRLAERNGFRQFARASRYGLGRLVFEQTLRTA
jgi:RimJ/RimL family protein N-acetyltransferase